MSEQKDIDNEKRCIAAQVICELYATKNAEQLRLLHMQVTASLRELGVLCDTAEAVKWTTDATHGLIDIFGAEIRRLQDEVIRLRSKNR